MQEAEEDEDEDEEESGDDDGLVAPKGLDAEMDAEVVDWWSISNRTDRMKKLIEKAQYLLYEEPFIWTQSLFDYYGIFLFRHNNFKF